MMIFAYILLGILAILLLPFVFIFAFKLLVLLLAFSVVLIVLGSMAAVPAAIIYGIFKLAMCAFG